MLSLHAAFVLLLATLCIAVPAPDRSSLPPALAHTILRGFSEHIPHANILPPTKQSRRSAWLSSKNNKTVLHPVELSLSVRQSGLNLDPCRVSIDCAGSRLCFALDSTEHLVPCSSGTFTDCFCRRSSSDDSVCTSNADCDDGESCGNVPDDSRDFCISDAILQSAPTPTTPVLDSSNPDNGDSEAQGASGGLTFDPCQGGADCQGSRKCVDEDTSEECSGDTCRCVAITRCEGDEDCEDGEVCASGHDFGVDSDATLCASRAARDAQACIAAHSLRHLSKEELVFEKHAIAHVLCDVNDSCATPGHMVRYKGKAMMMRSYCELTGDCVRKVMPVNSPRYRRRMTVPSRSDDLVFTTFAARFATRAEEGLLSVAIHAGL